MPLSLYSQKDERGLVRSCHVFWMLYTCLDVSHSWDPTPRAVGMAMASTGSSGKLVRVNDENQKLGNVILANVADKYCLENTNGQMNFSLVFFFIIGPRILGNHAEGKVFYSKWGVSTSSQKCISVCLSICLSVCLSVCLSDSLSLCLSLALSLSLSLSSLSLSIYLSLLCPICVSLIFLPLPLFLSVISECYQINLVISTN